MKANYKSHAVTSSDGNVFIVRRNGNKKLVGHFFIGKDPALSSVDKVSRAMIEVDNLWAARGENQSDIKDSKGEVQ